jgi:integrase/recombinase XerD
MSRTDIASPLVSAIAAYIAHRRALGRSADQEEWLLHRLRRFLGARGSTELDAQGFEAWRHRFRDRHPNSRHTYENIVYRFCCYRRRTEADCFLPDPRGFARCVPHAASRPIEPGEIARLLLLASALPNTAGSPLRPAVMRLALVLLYTSGLRLGELVRLRLGDVDPRRLILYIRESKFHRSRWVPLSASAGAELRAYLEVRDHLQHHTPPQAPLLCHRQHGWCGYSVSGMYNALHALFLAAGLGQAPGSCPRVHDIRHGFAIQALLRAYEENGDAQTLLPRLALYMGHVSIASTLTYLKLMPSVMAKAAERFERRFGELVQGGAS